MSTARITGDNVKPLEWFNQRIGKEVHAEGKDFDSNIRIENESEAVYCFTTQGGKEENRMIYSDPLEGIEYPKPMTVGIEMMNLRFQTRI